MTRKSNSVTIRDVARRAGVSVATVSRYINSTAPVSAETAERVGAVMAELSYAPHAAARTLATRRSRTLGLLLTNLHNDFFAPLVEGIEDEVAQQGYNLLVATHRRHMIEGSQISLGLHNVDGLMVFADSVSSRVLESFFAAGLPTVLVYRTPPANVPIPSITVENKVASQRLVSHLIETHQRRRIIFMRGPEHQEDSHLREMGYRAALKAHGLPFDPELILCGEFEHQAARDALAHHVARQLTQTGQAGFDAVFCGSDEAAVGVVEALRMANLRVPEDIAVVGFDDQRLASLITPPLTTVRAPTQEVGRIACQTLFKLLRNDPVDLITLLPTELVIRRSCGCSAA